jgi:CheY-like chemotaxis protein
MVFFLRDKMARKVVEENALCGSTPPKVLVVDDDHLTVQVVSRMVEVFGSRVDSAGGGVPALHYLSESRYDIVITDLTMPDLSGYILACWVREKSPDTKVIIMTGRSQEEVEHYRKTGMVDGWLFKPFSIATMEAMLNQIMEQDQSLFREEK